MAISNVHNLFGPQVAVIKVALSNLRNSHVAQLILGVKDHCLCVHVLVYVCVCVCVGGWLLQEIIINNQI